MVGHAVRQVKRSLKDEMYKAITHYSRPKNIGRSLVYRPLEVAQILMDHPALAPTLCPHLESAFLELKKMEREDALYSTLAGVTGGSSFFLGLAFIPGFADEFLALITIPIRWATRGALFKAAANKLNQVMRVSVAALGLKSAAFTFTSISKSQLDERMNLLEAAAISGDVDYPLLNRYKDLIARERWPAFEYGMEGMGIMGDLSDVAAVIRTIKLIRRGVGPPSSSLIMDGRPSNEALKAEVDAFSRHLTDVEETLITAGPIGPERLARLKSKLAKASAGQDSYPILLYQLRVLKDDPHLAKAVFDRPDEMIPEELKDKTQNVLRGCPR